MNFAFTGPRKLNEQELIAVWNHLFDIPYKLHHWHVGDAKGLDETVQRFAATLAIKLTIHEVTHHQPWGFAERSQRMVNQLGPEDKLIAFPNKPCPESCSPTSPFCGHGSGTWGTMAYAAKHNIQIQVIPLVDIDLPPWLNHQQLNLF
ncbi:MAG: hypothetical protein F6K24_31085 [Okeania sp. SIO2D1]|nr:hypothetical protein [Okeania sp. SIO2D1]